MVFIIGFFGNLLCLLVLCRRRKSKICIDRTFVVFFSICIGLRRNSYTQYLIALAIVDSGAILCEGT